MVKNYYQDSPECDDISDEVCHCGKPLYFGFDGDPTHTRGMCQECDAVRCDTYPGCN